MITDSGTNLQGDPAPLAPPLPAANCVGTYVPRYSVVARCLLAVAMVAVPGVIGLVAGMHSGWGEPMAYILPWAIMLFAIIYGPIALRPPNDPIALIINDIRNELMTLDQGMRLIGILHDRRSMSR